MSDTPEPEATEVEVGPDDNIEVSPFSAQQQEQDDVPAADD
jgi:hypothetical protein